MTLLEAFLLGIMVALTPSLLALGWMVWHAAEEQQQSQGLGLGSAYKG
jgi:hypothetical protein